MPVPPGPVRVNRRVSANRARATCHLRAADEARQLDGQVVRARIERAQRREPVVEAFDDELVETFRGGQVLQAPLAEIAHLHARRAGTARAAA